MARTPSERHAPRAGEGKPAPDDGSPGAILAAVSSHPEGAVVAVVAVPRASTTGFVRVESDAIRIKVEAAPVDGEANAALRCFLAEAVGVPRSRIRIISVDCGRRKRLLVVGMSQQDLGQRLTATGLSG